ncbi:hypothetical protein SBA3_60002 [Candidatus Sulfopaludibacter sp. SbA3]|nr:hypothetical protein SBA3_60002 [Candidatus Sulfopaludibacter sp. SbA3]
MASLTTIAGTRGRVAPVTWTGNPRSKWTQQAPATLK